MYPHQHTHTDIYIVTHDVIQQMSNYSCKLPQAPILITKGRVKNIVPRMIWGMKRVTGHTALKSRFAKLN